MTCNNLNLRNMILQELGDDILNLNVLAEGVCQLAQPVNIVPHERVKPVRDENYYQEVISHYTLDDFWAHFRMSRGTFEVLLNKLNEVRIGRHDGQEHVPFEKKVLFSIWILSKQESFIAAGDRFDMAKSTSHNIFFDVIALIAELRNTVIMWPNENEQDRISTTLQYRSNIPGIVGAIDGCHIAIKGPPHNAIDYYNRNNYHSVVLQGVCNDKKEFINIFVGTPGRVHDARVFRISPLYNLLTGDVPLIPENKHLLGDAAYPLLPFLLKPYRDNGHLTQVQTRFNTRMSSVRSLIEQTFGLLKCKFRRLKYLDMSRIDMIPSVITAACVLHNIILLNDGINVPNEHEEVIRDDGQNIDVLPEEQRNNIAEAKRNYIATLLH